MTIRMDRENDLTWFFGNYAFHRSTFGTQLEHAKAAYYDSRGLPIPRPAWDQQYVHVKKPAASEPGYEPDDEQLQTYARVSRRLVAVSRHADIHVDVLAAYYGNDGARWAAQEFGRIWAVTPLTPAGRQLLKREQSPLVLTPAERLANIRGIQKLRPNDLRGSLLRRMGDQADAMLRAAQAAWVATAPGFDERFAPGPEGSR